MKLSFITPSEFMVEFQSQGDFSLGLAHLIPSSIQNSQSSFGYETGLRKTGLPIILDNGLFEKHVPEPIDSLIEKAVSLKADLFFAPDCLFDKDRTMIELKRAIDIVKSKKLDLKVGAVVQADNVEDYLEQLLEFNEMEGVDLIGLSILSVPKSFGLPITESRIALMKKMIEISKESDIKWKNMHLLGIGDSYKDVMFAVENCPWVISNDSSCCFQSGLFGKRLTDDLEVPGGKIKHKVVFGLTNITDKQREDIQYNINKVKEVIKSLEKQNDNKS